MIHELREDSYFAWQLWLPASSRCWEQVTSVCLSPRTFQQPTREHGGFFPPDNVSASQWTIDWVKLVNFSPLSGRQSVVGSPPPVVSCHWRRTIARLSPIPRG